MLRDWLLPKNLRQRARVMRHLDRAQRELLLAYRQTPDLSVIERSVNNVRDRLNTVRQHYVWESWPEETTPPSLAEEKLRATLRAAYAPVTSDPIMDSLTTIIGEPKAVSGSYVPGTNIPVSSAHLADWSDGTDGG